MSSESKKKRQPTTDKITTNANMRDYSNKSLFIKKGERARKALEKASIPKEFLKGGKGQKK